MVDRIGKKTAMYKCEFLPPGSAANWMKLNKLLLKACECSINRRIKKKKKKSDRGHTVRLKIPPQYYITFIICILIKYIDISTYWNILLLT